MSKKVLILVITLCTVVLYGCSKNNNTGVIKQEENNINIEDTTKDESNNLNIKEEESTEKEEPTKEEETGDVEEKLETVEGRIYYHESFTGNNYYLNKELPKNDEEKMSEIIKLLKILPDNDYLENIEYQEFTPLRNDVQINFINIEDNLVEIDFNKNITDGLGSSGETSLIESLVKTIGYNYNVKNVLITFNGENYSSGHVVKEDGESFEVNNGESIELKKLNS